MEKALKKVSLVLLAILMINFIGGVLYNTETVYATNSAIKITAQPTDVTVAEGKQATWKVSAEGNNLKYQWQYKSSANAGWTNFQSATGASMTKTVGEWNGWQVRCVIKDGNGNSVTTNTVTIHISGSVN